MRTKQCLQREKKRVMKSRCHPLTLQPSPLLTSIADLAEGQEGGLRFIAC